MEELAQFLAGLAAQYPVLASIVAVVGVLRLINKPLFSFARAVVQATSSKKDDAILDSVEASKAYKVVTYVLDWFGSIKVAPSAPAAAVVEKQKH